MKRYSPLKEKFVVKYVYHITTPKNLKAILQSGLKPSSSNIEGIKLKNQSYKDRLFLALDKESAFRIAQEIGGYINNQLSNNNKKTLSYMVAVVIDFEKFMDNNTVKVYKDPDFQPANDSGYDFNGKGGIYIKESIPKKFIVDNYKIRLEDW